MLRKITVIIFFSLVLGGLLTIGIALACARWSSTIQNQSSRKIAIAGRPLDALTANGFGIERLQFDAGFATISRSMTFSPPDEPPVWVMIPTGQDAQFIRKMEFVGAGWPWICLRAHSMFDVSNFNALEKEWINGQEIGQGSMFMPFSTRIIPHGPYWPGLIRNWAVLSLPWLILSIGWIGARQSLRKMRGHCRKCGYDLQQIESTRCPECGQAINRPS